MWYPVLNTKQKQQTMIDTFGGYNHTSRPAESEFYDMQNMTGDEFPLLSTRGKRGILPVQDEYVGRIAKDGKLLCLKDSGAETFKLTVKDAVAAAEMPELPEGVTIPLGVSLEVYSGEDLSQQIGDTISFYDFSSKYENQSGKQVVMTSAAWNNLGKWDTHLKSETNFSIGKYNIGILPNSKWWRAQQIVLSSNNNATVLGSIYVNQNDALWSIPNGTEITVGVSGFLTVTQSINNRQVNSSSKGFFHYVKITKLSNMTNDGVSCIHFQTSLLDLCIRSFDFVKTMRGSFTIDEGTNTTRSNMRICYPIAYNTTDVCSFSKKDYDAVVAAANEEYLEILEEYEQSKTTQISVYETLTSDVVSRIKGRTVQIEESEVFVTDAIEGKSGTGYLKIEKPHDAIDAGAQIDVGVPFLSLCEVDPQTGTIDSSMIGLSTAEGERMMLSMGAKVVIFPEGIEVNTIKNDEDGTYASIESLELTSELRGNTNNASMSILITLCDAQYQYVGVPEVRKTSPTKTDGKYWLDNSKSDVHLKVYSGATNMWTEVETYLKIYSEDLKTGYESGDAVRILDGAKAWAHESISFLDEGDSHIIYAAGEEELPQSLQAAYGHIRRRYIVVRGILKDVGEDGTVSPAETDDVCMTIRRTVPDLDYIIESGNRLWGCRYGKNADGETVNEIYACKQGDPKNWFAYEGTAMDSYAASLGTDGPFTGAAVYAGNPVFFKENYMHRIYGSYPANYQILTQAVHGVQQGCAKSLAVVNERLFYKAQDGIYVYDGSLPYLMSDAFGQQAYSHAVGADGNGKYYVSLEKADGTRDLMVYDLQKRMWYREDDLPVRYMIPLGNTLIAATRDRSMIDLLGRNGEPEPDFEWYAESGNIGYAIAAKKFVGRMLIRIDLSEGAYVRVQIAYDNDRAYTDLFTSSEAGVGTICVPVRPHRCDHFRVRICGKGEAKLISVTKTISGGSER